MSTRVRSGRSIAVAPPTPAAGGGGRSIAVAPPTPAARGGGRSIAHQLARGAILGAALRVFSRRGIGPTRVEDILDAAGIARRTFYKYFASKDDVLVALYEVSTAELVRAIEAARAREPKSPLAGIRAGIDIFLGFYHQTSPRALVELVELAIPSSSPLAPRRRWLRAELVRILDDAVHALDGRRLDPHVYHALVSAFEGLSLELSAADTRPRDVARARDVANALVDHALGVRRPRPLPARDRS
jgi:AcrR family transcriptional regulator